MEWALGLQWCVQSDSFKFNITIRDHAHTRSGILSMVSSIYDHLGFLRPLTLPAKLSLQEQCRQNFGWDVTISHTLSEQWIKWICGLSLLADFEVPRCLKPKDFSKSVHSQIYHFSNASELGYGTVSCLRMTNTEGKVHVAFLMGKARVAPLKRQTIPRLELAAAALSIKVDRMLKAELPSPTNTSVFWSDSTFVLKSILNDHMRFHTYVANRLREATQVSQWRYIDTRRNPADPALQRCECREVHEESKMDLGTRVPLVIRRGSTLCWGPRGQEVRNCEHDHTDIWGKAHRQVTQSLFRLAEVESSCCMDPESKGCIKTHCAERL